MSITAQLRDSVRLPSGESLVNGFAFEGRHGGARRALLRGGGRLEVWDLDRLFAGEVGAVAGFAAPWPGWEYGGHSVSPDGAFAVFSGQRAVRAVGAGGETVWEYRHGCWGPELGHPHSGDEQEVCRGLEHGSCRVSDDGRVVWAHVIGDDCLEYWVVLDAADGRELARLPLDSAAAGSQHLSHPDGIHMGLSIGMGQDGILLHWARWDGERLTAWDLNETMDRILADVHPGHRGYLTVEHYGADLRLHALDGDALATAVPEAEEYWDYGCGFVDADTVIASTVDGAEDPDGAGHWLLDARSLEIRGQVTYPDGPATGCVRPLGDGTWLTYDGRTGTLDRWSAHRVVIGRPDSPA
ncbi:hypothetical protein [Streptomyces lavendulae]|uniref:hypothetical protein n=1 Tax=Streptomyces lavendulae TaxID=1914 RepID=UPI0024A37F74|nr:hypothetical protein [Streptomyces lavendulae]GLX18872.1 hypothetical protein Slala01_25160 [Streptomyces lavendulae subsp. lavendulae]GLX29206.1 hypothetical protein Slala02_50260 [Streptomyces lavendulae subsp. lavendulae]